MRPVSPVGRPRALVVLALLAATPSATAQDKGRNSVPAALGRVAAPFISAAAQPTLDRAEDGLHRVLADANAALEGRLGQVDSIVGRALDQADTVVDGAIGHADVVMAARIAQVDASADALVSKSLGGLDDISRKSIERATAGGQRIVRDLNGAARDRIDQADRVLEARIVQLDDAVNDALDHANQALEDRIDQVDQVAERRLGNLDVIASKQTLLIEGSLLKVASLVAALGMLVFGVWPALRDRAKIQDALAARRGDPGSRWTHVLDCGWWWGSRGVAAATVVVVLGLGARYLPLGSRIEVERLKRVHADGMEAALATFDANGVRYHAAQLTILDPSGEYCGQLGLLKADLFADVFERGAASPIARSGAVERDLERIDAYRWSPAPRPVQALHAWEQQLCDLVLPHDPLPKCGAGNDPDVLVAEAHYRWQAAATRADELAAAKLAAEALALDPAWFPLSGLAVHYIRVFLHDPPPGTDSADLERLRAAEHGRPAAEFRPFGSTLAFDALVMALEDKASPAYLAMLDAQAEVERLDTKEGRARTDSGLAAARLVRTEAAQEMIAAWSEFDRMLGSKIEPSTALGALELNDAPLVQALWYAARPESNSLAPRIEDVKEVGTRARMAPVRIEWARRYVDPLPPRTRQVVGFEEARRFVENEGVAEEFQQAYVAWRGAPSVETATRAACAGAELGIYTGTDQGRTALSTSLLPDDHAGSTDCGGGTTVGTRYARHQSL